MTRHIEVGPRDTSDVQAGALWLTDAGWYVLVLSPLTDDVWNIGCWPEAEGMDVIPGESTQASMIAADVLAVSGRCVQAPTPEALEAIAAASRERQADG